METYQAEQRESAEKLRGCFCHPGKKPGDRISFPSGSRYVIASTGAHWKAHSKLSKAERKRFKKIKRELRRDAQDAAQ